ncbi:uncharacterized protein LOC141614004 [Silene latifolia]|uniref:uncharacterized protein LOC141614004 n=1 Tax=Silene latifolia TaxID=37657 RepID=UPI003D76E429
MSSSSSAAVPLSQQSVTHYINPITCIIHNLQVIRDSAGKRASKSLNPLRDILIENGFSNDRSIVPSHRVVAILAAQRRLATVDNLQHRGLQFVNRCTLCKHDLETHQHLFFRCSFSQEVWTALKQWQHLPVSNFDLLEQKKWSYDSRSQVGWAAAWFRTALAAAIYGLWMERNRRIFMNQECSAQTVVNRVKYNVAVRLYMNPRFSNFVDRLCA